VSRTSPLTVRLSPQERIALEARARKYSLSYRDVIRAKVVLLAAQGIPVEEIAHRLDTPREVVWKWRKRFLEEGLAGLEERPRRGRPSTYENGPTMEHRSSASAGPLDSSQALFPKLRPVWWPSWPSNQCEGRQGTWSLKTWALFKNLSGEGPEPQIRHRCRVDAIF
jgi:transposase-like protein